MASVSDVKSDETVVLYPTYASLDADAQRWTVRIHGVIFEPEDDSRKRAALVEVLRHQLELPKHSPEAVTFEKRFRQFLVDNERGKRIVVRLQEQDLTPAKSTANGHFRGRFEIDRDKFVLPDAAEPRMTRPAWLDSIAVLPAGDSRSFRGSVQFVGRHGLSVVSDIDDTIKSSQVTDKSELLKNTFLRPFRAVPGMAKLYSAWAERGAAFHYVSAAPWQLYAPLSDFRQAAGFPRGTFHLRPFRLKDRSLLNVLLSPERYKTDAITPMLSAYPERKFVLVGDAGEQDPEIYAALAREHPRQIVGVFIRLLPASEQADQSERLERIAAQLEPGVFRSFDDPRSLEQTMQRLLDAAGH